MAFITPQQRRQWSVLRNFLVIAKTTTKQLSLKLPPVKAGPGAARRSALKTRGRRAPGYIAESHGQNCRDNRRGNLRKRLNLNVRSETSSRDRIEFWRMPSDN